MNNHNMKSNKNTINILAIGAASLIFLSLNVGCASSKIQTGQSTETSVNLSGKNYRLIEGGAKGTSHGFALLGIIPLASPHYADAKHDLYASVPGTLTGKAVALANEMDDRSTTYLILFSIPTLTVTADVIEFTDQSDKSETK
jgi:hypothetical protein